MFECVINISEGRSTETLTRLAQAAGASLRDVHTDPSHHRSVFTLINDATHLVRDVHSLVLTTIEALDLRTHAGVHPRLGVADVIPFVPLDGATIEDAAVLRDQLASWIAESFQLPVFLYGPLADGTERTLPYVRKHAFVDLSPDLGPPVADARSGAITVGARPLLIAWNLWLTDTSLVRAKALATVLRRPGLRTLGLEVAGAVQVSCNIIDVANVSLADVYDECTALLQNDERIARVELVGLAPQLALDLVDPGRWGQLDLRPDATIEARRARPAISWPGPDAR